MQCVQCAHAHMQERLRFKLQRQKKQRSFFLSFFGSWGVCAIVDREWGGAKHAFGEPRAKQGDEMGCHEIFGSCVDTMSSGLQGKELGCVYAKTHILLGMEDGKEL